GIALTLHGELARRRPSTRHLTGFYLWMSVGGMLGGVFNALVAPVIFVTAREYVVTLVVASFLIPNISAVTGPRPYQRALDVLIPLAVGALAAFLLAYARPIEGWLENLGRPRIEEMIYNIVVYGLPPMACYFFVDRPLRFGLCVAAVV